VDFFHKRSTNDAKVGDIILGKEEVGVPVALEMRLGAVAILGKFVLVAVEDLGPWILLQACGDMVKGVPRQDIVMIEEGDEIARGQF
jgi:hypothetical protein